MKLQKTFLYSAIIILIQFFGFSSFELYAQKVKKLCYKGKYDKAEEYCKTLETEEEKNACLTEIADHLYSFHNYDKAIEYYIKAGKKEEAYKKLGDMYFEKEEYLKAKENYEKAFSENNDKMAEHYLKIGQRYLELKQFSLASLYYDKAKNPKGFETLADGYFSEGVDYYDPTAPDADKKYKSAIQIFENAKFYYDKAFDDKKHDKIKECYKRIGDIWFDRGEMWRLDTYYAAADYDLGFEKVGDYYFKKRKYTSALKYYKKAYKKDKGKLNIRYKTVADIYYSSGDYMKAAEYYANAGLTKEEEKCYAHFFKTFKDGRDLKTYKYIKIGDQYWMAQNLAYEVEKGCWSYRYSSENVEKYGYLYTWETAKNVCPLGWRLPSREDFVTLLKNYEEDDTYNKNIYEGLVINKLGLRLQFAGQRDYDGKFVHMGKLGYLWTSTFYSSYDDTNAAYGIQIRKQFTDGGLATNTDTGSAKSVRCVKD